MAGKTRTDARILEHGDIFFFYRPKTGLDGARKLEDVASFHLVLHPIKRNLYRYAAVSLKGLLASGRPSGDAGISGWSAKLETVGSSAAMVARKLREAPPVPAARACGEGVYAIAAHGAHTHLAYVLELPEEPGEVQEALAISKRANPLISVINPILEIPANQVSPQVVLPEYPPKLMAKFGDKRSIPANPAELIDYEGAEILVAGLETFDTSLTGLDLKAEHEDANTAEVFELLKIRRSGTPLEPLFEGHWA
ncbi:MAG: hypothetical protein JWP91_2911 [Fibrobacteres bacterium]|nr:hypothetical protein [Fibrobacterota bacterium]